MTQQFSGLIVPLPGAKAVALTGRGSQWAMPGAAYISEVGVFRFTYRLNTTATYFSWVTG